MPNSPLPPFTPPRRQTARPPSPTFPIQQILSGAAISPVGCELIIQGVTTKSGLTSADVVRNKILTASTATSDYTVTIGETILHKVIVLPSNGRVRPERDSFCYIRLSSDVAAVSDGPRPDLLEQWIEPLSTLEPLWDVRWAPRKAGTDKSTWICLHGLPAITGLAARSERRDPRLDERNKVVMAELEKLGYQTISTWAMDKGEAAGVVLRFTKDVERALKSSPLKFRNLTNQPIHVNTPFRQIDPTYALNR